jgi:transcriptional regulator with XRE-family HTH domain
MSTLAKWLETRYLAWQVEQGHRVTLDEFANYLGFTRAYISMILNGSRTNLSMNTAYTIGERLGDFTILEVLGYPVPDTSLAGFTPEQRETILDFLGKVKVTLADLPPDEQDAKLNEILAGLPDVDTMVD